MGASDVKWNFRLTFVIDLPDSKPDTIMTSLMAAFLGIAAQVVHQVTVGFVEKTLDCIECPKCYCQGGHHWKTRHGEPTIFEIVFGKLRIPQLQLQCPSGHKFFITRDILGIQKRKHTSDATEKKRKRPVQPSCGDDQAVEACGGVGPSGIVVEHPGVAPDDKGADGVLSPLSGVSRIWSTYRAARTNWPWA